MLIAKVVITDLLSVDHTITPSGMGDADVLDVAFTHKAADDFVLTIGDKTGTIKGWLVRGCTVKIYIDTGPVPSTLKLHGMIENVTIIQPTPDFVLITATGRETFHVIINNRIVTETYLDYEVSEIVQDLMEKYAPEICVGYDFLSGWKNRIEIPVDKDDIDATLSNFPVPIHLSTSSGHSNKDVGFVFDELQNDANRKKIAVTTSDGLTECYVEVEKWDHANEQAWLWVKVPDVDPDVDTVLYLYYDSTHADNDAYVGDPSDAVVHNVWDANHKLVTHMRDDPDASHVRDSTVNANDGTKTGAGEPAVTVNGKVDDAQVFDGDDDNILIAHANNLDITDEITIHVWLKIDKPHTDTHGGVVVKGWDSSYEVFYELAQDKYRFGIKTAVLDTMFTSVPVADEFHLYDFTYDSSTGEMKVYEDGSIFDTHDHSNIGLINDDNDDLRIGRIGVGALFFKGAIDEVRISNVARTAAWIKAGYEGERDHLLDFGNEEVDYIDPTTTTLEDIRFPYRSLRECLDELARLSGFTYYCDPGLNLHWVEEQTEDSGFTYTEANIDASPEVIESLLPIKNRVYVIGGNYMQVDQEQTTVAATKNTKDFWYAQSFIPERSDLDQVSLHLKRTGDPDNLEGEIRTDDPGNGPDEIVATFTIDKDFVETTASWRPTAVEAQLLIGVKYWIVLQKVGDGANNYEWSDDNDNAGENAFDADGVGAWTVQAGSYQMAFKTHYIIPILSVASDFAHSATYKWRETVIEDKAIMSRALARETARAKLAALKDMTAQIRDIKVGAVTGIPALGKLVTITLTNQGIVGVQYVAKEARIKFKGGEGGAFFITLSLGREAADFAEWLRDLKAEVDRTKVGAFGVERGLINLIRSLSDTAEATDANLVGTVQLTGTFLIGTARIGFSDIG